MGCCFAVAPGRLALHYETAATATWVEQGLDDEAAGVCMKYAAAVSIRHVALELSAQFRSCSFCAIFACCLWWCVCSGWALNTLSTYGRLWSAARSCTNLGCPRDTPQFGFVCLP